ncbi:dGTP triphosphohydrolase [Achromobacter xylosoxidans]|uniref:dGTP triphosphohydrolase n=1 Tax=Alcaligenes xylosoxydans xylosoxydans TaxID=85698 RepID=UPI0006C00865|nr:dNTP triphosphohydrolase [Achromobacter xylosoxidans]CUI92616.1 Deoxyguanosinetriphosphate triphosphohydrolase [Achromobacter xylosoxidans]
MENAELLAAWKKLLDEGRRKPSSQDAESDKETAAIKEFESRTQHERDFDRILFSTPVRRLADKTQVFPLDKNDSVRNRLTHSYEVSNLARSLGVALAHVGKTALNNTEYAARNVPAILAATGLAHDLGNPPFGHQGEAAIQEWFRNNKEKVIKKGSEREELFDDFVRFEGNAQTFRLVTRLQLLSDSYGLNLTHATLAALMKYPVGSADIDSEHVARKKHGFFWSERHIAKQVLEQVGLGFGKRHPLAYLMEACDDIAYVTLDAEDTVKKGLASFSDLMAHLRHGCEDDAIVKKIIKVSEAKHQEYRGIDPGLSPAELNDLSMQIFRVHAIGALINAAKVAFERFEKGFVRGEESKSLLELSEANRLRNLLKKFSFRYGYTNKSVLALELEGYNIINSLMDMLWYGIENMVGLTLDQQKQAHPFARYAYGRISENYRRVADLAKTEGDAPLWYIKCQLLTDMLSGMTDSYALTLHEELSALRGDLRFKP